MALNLPEIRWKERRDRGTPALGWMRILGGFAPVLGPWALAPAAARFCPSVRSTRFLRSKQHA
ncbi:MAG: hypothetical protein BJG00_003640 [Limnothrix sp. CACIAM 69d]|nr:MAG: hypothetical protein BJG00_003640 [Limnothrix sp. CACIAM 69d]